ncbi:hypothetical protein AOLI_G00300480 [Acnodon oligacanthus]
MGHDWSCLAPLGGSSALQHPNSPRASRGEKERGVWVEELVCPVISRRGRCPVQLGGRGDTVFVKKSVGRNKLLPQGLAVYPSPENRETFAEERRLLREGSQEDRIQTRTGELTVEFLKKAKLEVGMPTSAKYQLTKEIVCRHFLRSLGLVVPTQALTLPDEPIAGLGDYWCEVTVNGVDTVRVPMSVVPFVEPRQRKRLKQEEQQPDPE